MSRVQGFAEDTMNVPGFMAIQRMNAHLQGTRYALLMSAQIMFTLEACAECTTLEIALMEIL